MHIKKGYFSLNSVIFYQEQAMEQDPGDVRHISEPLHQLFHVPDSDDPLYLGNHHNNNKENQFKSIEKTIGQHNGLHLRVNIMSLYLQLCLAFYNKGWDVKTSKIS